MAEAQTKFSKLKKESLLVQRQSGWATLSIYDILGVAKTTKISELKTKTIAPHFCAPLDSYAFLDFSKPILCTSDGAKTGKLMGQVWTA